MGQVMSVMLIEMAMAIVITMTIVPIPTTPPKLPVCLDHHS